MATIKELERPLGQNGSRGRRMSGGLPFKAIASGLALVCVLAVAGTIAMRDRPFRNPATSVETTPEMTAAPQAAAVSPAASEQKPADGPAIIQLPKDPPARPGAIVISDPSAIGQDLHVAHLPDRDLIEDSETGPLPVRAADGRRPFDVYARPWSGARGARVVIVLGGLGLSQTGTQAAIAKLPAEITLAFAPQGNSVGRWMQEARRKGHEIVMQVPLEPFDYPAVNPGRNTLTIEADAEENLRNLRWALSRTTNYTGVMNYMGARFSADADAMQPVFQELGKRGLLYFDDGSSARTTAPELSLKNRVPFAAGDNTIDGDRNRGAILKKLDELESTARARGFAIGSGSVFDETVDAVSGWVAEAKKRGIEIVPISAVAIDPERG